MSPFRSIHNLPIVYLRWFVLSNSRTSSHRRQSQGMAQIVVMLLMLTILTTSLAIASRVTAGLYSQTLQARLRLAKDVAEYGITITVHELNKPGNRLFLGRDYRNNGWINAYNSACPVVNGNRICSPMYRTSTIPNWDQNRNLSNYPCYIYAKETPKYRIYRPTSQAASLPNVEQNPKTYSQIYTDNNQSYRIIGMKLYDKDHRQIYLASSNSISYLVLVVEGIYNGTVGGAGTYDTQTYVVDSSRVNSAQDVKYTIQQEYEVIPRCCHASFGTVGGVSYGYDASVPTSCPNNTEVVWALRSNTRTANYEGRP